VADAPDEAVDRLYGLPRDEFIGARDALARELRVANRREEAAAVKALPKPTVAAWAVNQAVRSQPPAARELWEAGDALAAAQEAILAGKGSGSDMRAATERERAAVEPLVDAARGLLTSTGGDLSEATIERVRETLHAAAIDPDARDEVAAGRATRERSPRGLFGGEPAPPPPRARDRGGSAGKGAAEPAAPERGRAAGRKGASAREPAAPDRDRAAGRTGARARGTAARQKGDEAAARKREREEAAARKREEAAARKREREEAAARERARKAAADRVSKAERNLAQAEARSATAAERLEEARTMERAALEALADARAELRALER
jgi:hypothetical protein